MTDICPFTALGTFNRSITDANRREIAADLAELIGVEVAVPDSFEGIPFLNNQKSWFYGYAKDRGDGDIDALWEVFVAASRFVGSDQLERRVELIAAYNEATNVRWGGVESVDGSLLGASVGLCHARRPLAHLPVGPTSIDAA